jgi:putative nucleotidyltransferase with HDIG domain
MRGLPQGTPREDGPGLPPPGLAGPVESRSSEDVADLWEHTMRVLDRLGDSPSFPLALAALLHDVGKPRTVGRTPDRYTFHGHEHVGRRMAGEIALRLKLSNDERERVEWLVEKHQILADVWQMRPSKLKPILNHPGVEELFALHDADARAWGRETEHVDEARARRRAWEEAGELDPPPVLTGDDLVAMGLSPGPQFKKLLGAVRDGQLDGQVKSFDEACALVRRMLDAAHPGC